MAVGPFLSCDAGFSDLLGLSNWTSTNIAVCLVDHAAAASFNRAATTFANIKGETEANIAARGAINTPAVAAVSEHVRFTHAKQTFADPGSLSGRYVVYILGNHASLDDADKVIGYVDLTGDGNASSVDAEFSFTPDGTNGLFRVARSAAPS